MLFHPRVETDTKTIAIDSLTCALYQVHEEFRTSLLP